MNYRNLDIAGLWPVRPHIALPHGMKMFMVPPDHTWPHVAPQSFVMARLRKGRWYVAAIAEPDMKLGVAVVR